MARKGEIVKVFCVDCGVGLKRRLCDLGLYDGALIKIVKNDISSPVIVKIFDSQIALGRGQAHKIIVEPQIIKRKK